MEEKRKVVMWEIVYCVVDAFAVVAAGVVVGTAFTAAFCLYTDPAIASADIDRIWKEGTCGLGTEMPELLVVVVVDLT